MKATGQVARSLALQVYGWPPVMTTAIAALYTCTSRWTIARAVVDGELAAIGRRGKGLLLDRDELDRWSRAIPPIDIATVAPPMNPPIAKPAAKPAARRATTSAADSIAKIKKLARRRS